MCMQAWAQISGTACELLFCHPNTYSKNRYHLKHGMMLMNRTDSLLYCRNVLVFIFPFKRISLDLCRAGMNLNQTLTSAPGTVVHYDCVYMHSMSLFAHIFGLNKNEPFLNPLWMVDCACSLIPRLLPCRIFCSIGFRYKAIVHVGGSWTWCITSLIHSSVT